MSGRFIKLPVFIYAIGIVGTFLIMAALVWALRHYTAPAPVNANRAAERAKNLQDLRGASAKILGEYDWRDQTKGVVRLPIERGMELMLQEWQDPAAARSNLFSRVDQMNPPPPPPAPPQPSPFE